MEHSVLAHMRAECTGEYCESKVDACQSIPCLNNGTCISSSLTSSYTCTCPLGFTGRHCSQGNRISSTVFFRHLLG